MVNIARSLQSERVSVRAFCKVCERRRWGGHVGTFQYDPNKSHTRRFPITQRVSRFKVGKNVAGYVSEPRPRSVPVSFITAVTDLCGCGVRQVTGSASWTLNP